MFQSIIEFIKNLLGNKPEVVKEELPTQWPSVQLIFEPETSNKDVKTKVMTDISKHVTLAEVIHSNTAIANGIDNTPTDEQLELIKEVAVNVFDPLREHTGGPIKINSVYRGPALNKEIGGSKTSQHCVGLNDSKNSYGAAIDIDDEYWKRDRNTFNNTEMGDWIRENLDFDQLIYEKPINGYPSWIHVSYRGDGKNRNQVMIYLGRKGGYIPYAGNEHRISNPDLDQ